MDCQETLVTPQEGESLGVVSLVNPKSFNVGTIKVSILLLLFVHPIAAAVMPVHADSQCYGTVSNGRIVDSINLPIHGINFTAYSSLATMLGRTHVHSKVAEVIAEAYSELRTTLPDAIFVYGETGWPSGGRFRPHRTHQNGLSVDFFVPVRNKEGKFVTLPTSPINRFGYDIEFDADSRYEDYEIDYSALAEHLYQLDKSARKAGIGIALVIIDKAYLPKLFASRHGTYLRDHVPFMKGKPWVRHDEHYHVDFAVPCQPTEE